MKRRRREKERDRGKGRDSTIQDPAKLGGRIPLVEKKRVSILSIHYLTLPSIFYDFQFWKNIKRTL